jgi:hypothetical protein
MVAIHVDEQTAHALELHAQRAGMNLADYLRLLADTSPPKVRRSWDEIERDMEATSFYGPTIPADFSRADIYSDHD